jgi:ADP-ribosylglycohydrolase
MRVLPLALWHTGSDGELVRDAAAQSRVTHGHVRAQLSCALYCLWARRTLQGGGWDDAVASLRALVDGAARAELEQHLLVERPVRGSGYVVDTLHAARWAVAEGPFEIAVRAAISLGDDTDTTACIAGGIAGARDGLEAIPRRWREALRGRELCDPLLEALR